MQKSKIALAILALCLPAAGGIAATSQREKPSNTSITVTETVLPETVSTENLSAEQLQRIGANDFGSIMRYQPLISASGSHGGSSNGKSSFDRSGYTGYNIRGLDANRIALDVDGIPLPDATGRSYDPVSGESTFGIGRDYIDPYLYGRVTISAGAAMQNKVNNAVGGSVSFVSKSPDSYLTGDKDHYFSYTSNYDSADHSWHNGITSAVGNDQAQLLFAYSRRDGQQTRDNSDWLDSYPMRWNSNAFLVNGIYHVNDTNQLNAAVDFYRKSSRGNSSLWEGVHTAHSDNVIGLTSQQSVTQRYSVVLKHEFMPENNPLIDRMENKLFWQQTHVNDQTLDAIDADIYAQKVKVNPRFASFNSRNQWTISGLDTKTYGLGSEITKHYHLQQLNYGINFANTKTDRPFRQVKDPVSSWTHLQPQGNSDTYDINVWLRDTISLNQFTIMPELKYSWHRITPKGFVNPASDATGVFTGQEVNELQSETFNDGQLLPGLTLLYSINPQFNTWLQYKRGVSYPTTSQLFGVWFHPKTGSPISLALLGNPELKTETSNQFEWGLAGEVTPGITMRASIFYNDYQNFIGTHIYPIRSYDRRTNTVTIIDQQMAQRFPDKISSLYLTENRDKAYIYGGELSSKLDYGKWFSAVDGLSTTLAVGLSQGKSKSASEGDGWVDIDSVLPMKGIVSLAWDDPQQRYGARLTATFVKGKQAIDPYRQRYNSGKPGTFDEQASKRETYMRIPGFGTLDFAAYYNINKSLSINAGVYNITNRRYWDYASNKNLTMKTNQDIRDIELGTAPGRTYQLGVTATF